MAEPKPAEIRDGAIETPSAISGDHWTRAAANTAWEKHGPPRSGSELLEAFRSNPTSTRNFRLDEIKPFQNELLGHDPHPVTTLNGVVESGAFAPGTESAWRGAAYGTERDLALQDARDYFRLYGPNGNQVDETNTQTPDAIRRRLTESPAALEGFLQAQQEYSPSRILEGIFSKPPEAGDTYHIQGFDKQVVDQFARDAANRTANPVTFDTGNGKVVSVLPDNYAPDAAAREAYRLSKKFQAETSASSGGSTEILYRGVSVRANNNLYGATHATPEALQRFYEAKFSEVSGAVTSAAPSPDVEFKGSKRDWVKIISQLGRDLPK